MAIAGGLVLDGFDYQVAEVVIPTIGQNGEIAGSLPCRELRVQSDGIQVVLRLVNTEWDAFARALSGSKIVVAQPGGFPGLNGSG